MKEQKDLKESTKKTDDFIKKKALVEPPNQVKLFEDMRNYLAANVSGVTRDEILAKQMIDILLCKVYDEVNKEDNEFVDFLALESEDDSETYKRIEELFEKVKGEYPGIFEEDEEIRLDPTSIKYIVESLQKYCLTKGDRDAIRQVFEVFIGPALRGSEGQFFTPRNVIKTCVDILDPEPSEKVIDPACGTGGFLIASLDNVVKKYEDEVEAVESLHKIEEKKMENSFSGIDKDQFLARVTKAYMAILGDGRKGIVCENSLNPPEKWEPKSQNTIKLGEYDVLLTNPPFGANIKIDSEEILSQYELGYSWRMGKNELKKVDRLRAKQPPQVLFIERCLQLLKEGGRMGIVLPEGILGNPNSQYIRKFIKENAKILGIIDAPKTTFQPSTHTKTCILFLEKDSSPPSDYPIFMSVVKSCGHDSRGNPVFKRNKEGELIRNEAGEKIMDDDFKEIPDQYKKIKEGTDEESFNSKGFEINLSELEDSDILVPRFYSPEIEERLKELERGHELVSVRSLEDEEIISIFKGKGIRKKYYGTGNIPYVRTSDVSNLEINVDYTHAVSEKIYEKFKQDIRKNDILFVRDGTYLIGDTCILTDDKPKFLVQSHFDVIRCLEEDELDPFLLLFLLNTKIVQKQVDAYTITQSTISTVGSRLYDIVLPIPKEQTVRREISRKMKEIVQGRHELKKEIRELQKKEIESFESLVKEE